LLAAQLAPTFDTMQRLATQLEVNSPAFSALVKKTSNQYRATIELVNSRSESNEWGVMLELWSLIDIMLIDSRVEHSFANELLDKLLKWSASYNDKISELELKAFQSADQFNCVEFWHLVAANIMCGELTQAAELIQQHPDYSEQNRVLSTVHRWIASRPLLSHFSVSGSQLDFEAAFIDWQNMIADNFDEIDFDDYPGLERVAGIICGDEATIDDCLPLVGQWYRLLIAKCFLLCPTTDPRIIINSSNIPAQNDADNQALMDLVDRIFELDVTQILRDMVALSDNWWFVAHNADLLSKLDPDNEELHQLRDTFILNYAESLLADEDTWFTALQYMTRMSEPDAERIENEIMECTLVGNRQAERIYNLPLKLQLPNANAVRNRIATKFARQLLHDPAERGNALCWALRARDESICAQIAHAELSHFHQTESWSIATMIDALESGRGGYASEQLTFLAKYKQFYGHVHSSQINAAAEDLIAILACHMSSEILTIILKQALLLLDEDFTFTRNQIICIMRALQKQKESSRLRGVKLNPTEIEQGKLLSKSLARHLSRSIIKSSSR